MYVFLLHNDQAVMLNLLQYCFDLKLFLLRLCHKCYQIRTLIPMVFQVNLAVMKILTLMDDLASRDR